MAAHDVVQVGTDTSGRPVYMTVYMRDWWAGVVRELGWEPTIIQGAFMVRVPGGGADDSAGYHDGGGCLDLRTWDRSATQTAAMVRAIRHGGAAAWVRDREHGGMAPHLHLVLGSDFAVAKGASWQFLSYINAHDGLTPPGPDYHPRPQPLVVRPPDEYMEAPVTPEEIDRIADAVVKRLLDTKLPDGDTVRQSIRQAGDTKAIASETLRQVKDLK